MWLGYLYIYCLLMDIVLGVFSEGACLVIEKIRQVESRGANDELKSPRLYV